MPIRNQQPAHVYGLSLLQNGGRDIPTGGGGAEIAARALQPIMAAMLMKYGDRQQAAADQQMASSYADILSQQDPSAALQQPGVPPELIAQLAPQLMAQKMQFNSPQAQYEREVAAYDRKGKEADALNEGVQNTLERSLSRGDRANEMVNTRNFQRDQLEATQAFTSGENALNRANTRDIANINNQPGATSETVQSVIPNGDGTNTVVYRSGRTERLTLDGEPVKGSRNDPSAIFNQSAARSGGRAAGVLAETAPVLDANFSQITKTLEAFDAPNVKAEAKWALGAGSYAPTIPGVNSDFRARRDQLKGQAFLQSYQSLKGGGAITEVEGLKGEQSIARLNDAQTPSEFYEALKDAKATFAEIYAAAKDRANRGAVVPQLQQQGGAPQSAPKSLNWNELP